MSRKATESYRIARVISRRDCSWAGAPCQGFLALYEQKYEGVWSRPDIPWDDSWEPGTIVEVEMIARVVKFGAKSTKKCHVPWPAHVHDDEKKRRDKRAARRGRR